MTLNLNIFRKKNKEKKGQLSNALKYDMFRKCTKVIDSCIGQLNSSVRYCNLYLNMKPDIKDAGPSLKKYCDEKFKNLKNR